jgi:hypothetical protein
LSFRMSATLDAYLQNSILFIASNFSLSIIDLLRISANKLFLCPFMVVLTSLLTSSVRFCNVTLFLSCSHLTCIVQSLVRAVMTDDSAVIPLSSSPVWLHLETGGVSLESFHNIYVVLP